MAAPWLAPLPHSKKFLGSNPPSGLSVWSLHLLLVSVLVCSAAICLINHTFTHRLS